VVSIRAAFAALLDRRIIELPGDVSCGLSECVPISRVASPKRTHKGETAGSPICRVLGDNGGA